MSSFNIFVTGIFLITLCCVTQCVKGQQYNCTSSKECNDGTQEVAICRKAISQSGIGECDCHRGYTKDEEWELLYCIPIFGKPCSSSEDCIWFSDEKFECNNDTDTCNCQQGTILHPQLRICVAKPTYVNAACSFDDDCDLIPYTICDPVYKACVCPPKSMFQSSKTKVCHNLPQNLGSDCDFDNHCNFTLHTSCLENRSSNTAWGYCSCRSDAVPVDSLCKLRCDTILDCTANEYCHFYSDTDSPYCEPKKNIGEDCPAPNVGACKTNSECNNEGTCECIDGFKPNPANNNQTCIAKICPVDIICSVNHFCNASGICENKKDLGSRCNFTAECKGTNSQCGSAKLCECKIGFKPNQMSESDNNNCILRSCAAGDFTCSIDQYCDGNSGACRKLKPMESICLDSYECAGFDTRNIACVDRFSNGIKSCYCTNSAVPDRPVTDPNVTCIQRVENNKQCTGRDSYGTLWTALPGETKTRACPGKQQGGLVVWQCQTNGVFLGAQPNYDNCKTAWVSHLNETLQNLLGPNNSTIAVKNATIFMKEMTEFLDAAFVAESDQSEDEENEDRFFGHEIQNLIEFVNVIVTKMDASDLENATRQYETVVGEAIAITEKLIQFTKPWEQLTTMNRTAIFANVLHTIEQSALQLANRVNNSSLGKSDCDPNLCFLKTYKQKAFSVTSGISGSSDLVYPIDSRRRKGKDSFIELPANWQNINVNQFLGSGFVGMEMKIDYAERNIAPYVLNHEDSKIVGSKSLNSNLLGFRVSHDQYQQGVLEDGSVMVTFQHNSDSWGEKPKRIARKLHPGEIPRAAGGTGSCSRFDETQNVYTTEGCELVETGPFSTTCKCDRLGQYALQTEFHEYPGKSTSLETMTILGFGVAILVHGNAFLNSDSDPENMQKNMKNFMMVFLMATNILLVAFVDRNYFYLSDFRCYLVGMVTHFVGLCGLMCIATAALHVYMFPQDSTSSSPTSQNKSAANPGPGGMESIKLTIKNYRKIIYFSFIVGVPILIGGVTMIVGAVAGDNSRVYGGDFCWLDGPYIWAFFSPVILAVVANLALYLIITRYADQKLKESNNEEMKQFEETRKKCMEQNVAFSVLVGLTWAVGYFQLGPTYSDSEFAQYAFPAMAFLQSQIISRYELEEKKEEDEYKEKSSKAIIPWGGLLDVGKNLYAKIRQQSQDKNENESLQDVKEEIVSHPSKNYHVVSTENDDDEIYFTAGDETDRRLSLAGPSKTLRLPSSKKKNQHRLSP